MDIGKISIVGQGNILLCLLGLVLCLGHYFAPGANPGHILCFMMISTLFLSLDSSNKTAGTP